MANRKQNERLFRLSLRELLVLVSLVALAIASLKYASEVLQGVVAAVVMIALVAALIVAAVDRGSRQVFAIGFALVMLAYGLMLTAGGAIVPEGRLLTTLLLRLLHTGVARSEWNPSVSVLQQGASSDLVGALQKALNARMPPGRRIAVDGDFGSETAAAVRRFQAQAGLPATGVVDQSTWKALGPLTDATGKRIPVYVETLGLVSGGGFIRETPRREMFMTIGHCWWALLLGYLGGWFAMFVYRRRKREQARQVGHTPG